MIYRDSESQRSVKMAGDLSLVAIETPGMSITAINHQWEIEFSRFFNYPSISAASLHLRSLPRHKKVRCRGTWLSSSSTASLHLIVDHSIPDVIIRVSFQGKIHEEHFISKLHFSWPQVSCAAQFPPRGSRVVFSSYRDCAGQIQKFALRFSTSCEAETFTIALKEKLKDVRHIGFSGSEVGSDISSQSDIISSNTVQYRADEESFVNPLEAYSPQMPDEESFVNPLEAYSPQMPLALNYKGEEHRSSQETVLGHRSEGVFSAFPPSFTELLTNCSSEAKQDRLFALLKQEPRTVPEENDLKTQIMKYMTDSSFHDMLSNVEKVITELGGDLAV